MSTELKELELSILSCTNCGDVTTTHLKSGEVRTKPLVEIPKGAVSLVDSSKNPVPGHSMSDDIDYLWIGESPGENEDIKGEPFVGVSGKYLKQKLIARIAKLPLERCRFTNMVKCHPVGNRDPYKAEVNACWPWLETEINLTRPKVIFLLGAVATKAFLGETITRTHGQVYEWNGYPVMALYHPAAVNRAITRKALEKDYAEITEKLAANLDSDGLRRPASTRITLIDDDKKLEHLLKQLEGVNEFGFDIETDESEDARKRSTSSKAVVDPLTNTLDGISIALKVDEQIQSYYIPTVGHKRSGVRSRDFYGLDSWDDVRAIVCRLLTPHILRCEVFIHNAKFEMASLEKYGLKFRKVFCTYLAAYILREQQLGLKNIVKSNFGISMHELSEFVNLKTNVVSDAPLAQVFPYACADAEYCYKYGLLAKEKIKEQGSEEAYRIRLGLLPWVVREELQGIEIDEDKRLELDEYFTEKIEEVSEEIQDLVGYDFNLNSNKQMSEALFDELGLPRTKLLPSGYYSTDKEELAKIAGEHDVVPLVSKRNSFTTIKNTFIDGPPRYQHPETYKLHSSVNLAGTETTRFSYSGPYGPNWQNIPVKLAETRRIREFLVADEVGYVIVAIDQSQIELRWAAHLSKDPWMLEVFRDTNRNIHTETCQYIYKIEKEHPDWIERYKSAKNGNFCRLFDGKPPKLAETLQCSLSIAKEFYELHLELMAGFAKWTVEQKKACRKLGYAETWTGFKRMIPEIQSNNSVMRSRGERVALNLPIQGGAAQHIQAAMVLIDRELERRRVAARMLIQVHDELVFSALVEDVPLLVEIATKHMEGVIELEVPTPVEVKVGPSWGELVPYEEWQKEEEGVVV